MKDEKPATLKEVEENMACSAFAEEGEPCPMDTGTEAAGTGTGAGKETLTLEAVEKDFACTAFHDQNLNCPIDGDKK